MAGGHLRAWVGRFATPGYRRILIACAATLCVSLSCLGLIGLMRWRGRLALQGDTRAVAAQASEQLLRGLTSRRGTLTFIRDTLNRTRDLTPAHLEAVGDSATKHTRHLLGIGFIRAGGSPLWWSGPQTLSAQQRRQLDRLIVQRASRRGAWRISSTFGVTVEPARPLLIMLEPLRAAAYRQSVVLGVFDLQPLLEDFVRSQLTSNYPLQVLDGETLLYRSQDWPLTAESRRSIVVEAPVTMDAARWTLQIQPGSTQVIQTLSWLSTLLIALSLLAGLGITTLVWILAARTWLLQRAVRRRTAVLRRTSERLRQLATTDELTGLYNRRFFLNRWAWECDRAKRYRRPLACLLVDVNGFKQVNDRLGHHAGDQVLRDVARELKAALRQSDILARFGGDEFIVALPETSHEQAEAVAEKLRRVTIQALGGKHRVPLIRLSVGISHIRPEDERPEDTIQAADESLYTFKRQTKTARTRESVRVKGTS